MLDNYIIQKKIPYTFVLQRNVNHQAKQIHLMCPSLNRPVTKNQNANTKFPFLMIFVVITIQKRTRQPCLFSFRITTTTKIKTLKVRISYLVFRQKKRLNKHFFPLFLSKVKLDFVKGSVLSISIREWIIFRRWCLVFVCFNYLAEYSSLENKNDKDVYPLKGMKISKWFNGPEKIRTGVT